MPKFTITPPAGAPVTVEAPSREAALDQVLDAQGPNVSALGSFGRGATGMIPLGNQAYASIAGLAEHKPYEQERQELNQEIAADKETNPGSRLVGQAAGLAAPIIATGGLAAPETLGGAALQGAGFGGLYGAGNAIDTLSRGGSGAQAAGDVAMGAGFGAAGGAAGHGIGQLLGGLGRKAAVTASKLGGEEGAIPVAAQVGEQAAEAAPKAAEAATPIASEAPAAVQGKQGFFPSPEELRAEILAGNLGGSPRQLRAMPGKDIVQSLNHMGDIIKANSTSDNPLIGMTDRYSDRLRKFVALNQKSGKTIGNFIENAGAPPMPTADLASQIQNSAKFLNPSDQAQLQSVIGELDKYSALDKTPGAISFKRLQQLKGDLGDTAFHGQGNPVLQGAYHVISDAQENEIEKLGPAINKPEFMRAKEAYQMTSRAIPMLRMATARSLAKGYSAFGAPLAALVTGHPVAALGTLLKEPLQRAAGAAAFGAPEIGETLGAVPSAVGAQAAKAAPVAKAVTDIPLNHPSMAPWRKFFIPDPNNPQKMADGGVVQPQEPLDPAEIEKHNTVADFTLSQRDPAYAKAKQEALDNPQAEAEPKQMADGGVVTSGDDAADYWRQKGDYPEAGAEIPLEQRGVNALNTVAAGYGAGQLGGNLATKGYQVAKNLGEAGAIFPHAMGLNDIPAETAQSAQDIMPAVKTVRGEVKIGGPRDLHHDIMQSPAGETFHNGTEGFFDRLTNRFLTREEAADYVGGKGSLMAEELLKLKQGGLKLFDPANPPMGESFTAMRLKNGEIVYSPTAKIHADLVNQGLDPEAVVDGGFINSEGKYISGSADTPRIVRMAQAKKRLGLAEGGYVSQADEEALLAKMQPPVHSPEIIQLAQNRDNSGLSPNRDSEASQPMPGFTSTLPGLEKLMRERQMSASGDTPPAPVVRQAAPVDQFHQPFNPQLEEQLKAFMMGAKKDDNAE